MRARADDIMMGRVVHEGLFFQRDSQTGRYERSRLRARVGGAERRVPKDREAGGRPVLPRVARERPLRARGARDPGPGRRALSRDAIHEERAGRHRASVAPGRRQLLGARPRSRAADMDGPRRHARANPGCLEVVDASHEQGLATPLGGTIQPHIARERRAEERVIGAPGSRRRSDPHSQLPLAPLRLQHDRVAPSRLHRRVHRRGHPVHAEAQSPTAVHACIRPRAGWVRESGWAPTAVCSPRSRSISSARRPMTSTASSAR